MNTTAIIVIIFLIALICSFGMNYFIGSSYPSWSKKPFVVKLKV